MATESKRITYGDSDYDDIHTAWVANGRPHQFDRMGSWGGAIYNVHDVTATYPDFYQRCSLVETTLPGDDDPSTTPTQEGWWLINRRYLQNKIRRNPRYGTIEIARPEVPNEL